MKLELDEELQKKPKVDEGEARRKQSERDRDEQIEIANKIIEVKKAYREHGYYYDWDEGHRNYSPFFSWLSIQELYDLVYPDLKPPELEKENPLLLPDRSKPIEPQELARKELRERNKEKLRQFEKQEKEYYQPDETLFKLCLLRLALFDEDIAIESNFEEHNGMYEPKKIRQGEHYKFSKDYSPYRKKLEEIFDIKEGSRVELEKMKECLESNKGKLITTSDILHSLYPDLTKRELLQKELLLLKLVYLCKKRVIDFPIEYTWPSKDGETYLKIGSTD